VTIAETIASEIVRRQPVLKRGSLSVYGDIFGGRIDNIHTVTGAHVLGPDRVVIEFNEGETLDVWDPEGATISKADFKIRTASRARWEWFYYGRPHAPENRYFIEHVRAGDAIWVTTDVDWAPLSFAPSTQRPAVELLGLW
jgi:hypothetical protein